MSIFTGDEGRARTGEEGRSLPRPEDDDVVAAVDRSDDGHTFVVADVTKDDVWLAMPAADAPSLAAWR